MPDVGRGGKGAIEMHPFDNGICRQNQPFVPDRRQNRRIVSRSDKDRGRGPWQASQDSRQKGVFTDVVNGHRQPIDDDDDLSTPGGATTERRGRR